MLAFDFGLRLQTLRKAKGYSQNRVASMMGISKSSISAYENNLAQPSLDMIKGFSTLFRVSSDYLLGIESEKAIILNLKSADDEMIVRRMVEVLQEELNKARS